MKVLFICLTGWMEQFNDRIQSLATTADEVVVIRSAPRSEKDNLRADARIRVIDIPPARDPMLRSRFQLLLYVWYTLVATIICVREARKASSSHFVMHAYDQLFSATAARMASKITRAPFILSLRGAAYDLEKQRRTAGDRIVDVITRPNLRAADLVIAKAEHLIEAHQRHLGIHIRNWVAIPTGVDFSVFGRENIAIPDHVIKLWPGHASYPTRVCYLGRLTPEKGILELINGFAETSDRTSSLILVGHYRDLAFLNMIRMAVREKKLESRVRVHADGISYADVPALLKSASCIVLLSKGHHEGVPRVLQEACALGVPVVATSSHGIIEAFQDFPNVALVRDLEPKTIAHAIARSSSGTSKRAIELSRERFDIARNYAKYIAHFEKTWKSTRR